jgi:DNA-binding SARP family transcriptional activator
MADSLDTPPSRHMEVLSALDTAPEVAILGASTGAYMRMPRSRLARLEESGLDKPRVCIQGADLALDKVAAHRRRDSYRLLARRAASHAHSSVRHMALARASNRRITRSHQESMQPGLVDAGSSQSAPEAFWTAEVQIRCFGRFELSRNGVAVQHWRRRSAERLLKLLLVNGRRIHRDVLLDLLWPDVPIKSSIPGLRVTLHALRRAIAQVAPDLESSDLIRAEGDTYVLNTQGLWIDSDAFDEHYSAGLRFERAHQIELAMREYTAAEALYRDDFLVEDLYEDWTVLPREELKDKYLLILTRLSQFNMASMDLDGCIRRSHALLAKEPCREDAYQRLMQCYARLGQRGSALRWYQICERTLHQELDVAPSEDTRRLFQEINAASA